MVLLLNLVDGSADDFCIGRVPLRQKSQPGHEGGVWRRRGVLVSPRLSKPSQEPSEIGRRVRVIRRRRGLSQETVAGLAGISNSYLSRIESGERRVERRGLLEDLANALGCSVVDLTGEPYLPVDRPSATALATIPAIELALFDMDLADVPDQPVRPVDELARLVREANGYRDRARYDIAGRELGVMLTELQIIVATSDEYAQHGALTALVEACYVAYAIAKYTGHSQLAVVAARRGYEAARRLGDPMFLGFARWYYTLALMRIGARRRASATLALGVDELAGVADPSAEGTLAAEVYGMLHLTAALEAAKSGQADDAASHLIEARTVAARIGERNGLLMHFGPSNVSAWTASIGVELGQGARVYEQARREPADLDILDSPNRQSAWHFDLARALAQEDGARDWDAIRHLDTAERLAPQQMRHDPIARELVLALDGRARTRVWELDSLKHRLGVGRG